MQLSGGMNNRYSTPDNGELAALQRLSMEADRDSVRNAILSDSPGIHELAALLSPAAGALIDTMAPRARALTLRHFGHTIQMYAPLYLSDYCSSECAYCGFAADRKRIRRKLERDEIIEEMNALRNMGFDEILLLTGERTIEADFDYLRRAVELAAERFHLVSIETFPMTLEEYRILSAAGCSSVTVYQETYDREVFKVMHRKGPKSDYENRLDTPARALSGGMRFAGMGVLLGLSDPVADALSLFHHAEHLKRTHWRAGISISFPRIRPQLGEFVPPHPVGDSLLAQLIFAFRIIMPDTPLVLSTRESGPFRDAMAGLGICKMSAASRTSVGGYVDHGACSGGQFEISDTRDTQAFCAMLKQKGLEPVFKNWDAVYRAPSN